MTIAVGWLRKIDQVQELIICTDSRLGGFGRWDCGPKLLPLPRQDSVLAFAGHTLYAYPILIQTLSAITQHPKIMSRALDLAELKGHLIRVLNSMVGLIKDLPKGEEIPDVQFLLAGWCWRTSRFVAWVLHYDHNIQRFTHRPLRHWSGANEHKFMFFIGDLLDTFKSRLVALLRERDKLRDGGFDMEPFEVLRDMLRSGEYDEIGGAPQLIKVYRHMNVLPHAVFWPSAATKSVSLLGRPLLDYERSQYLVLDPDTLTTMKHADVA